MHAPDTHFYGRFIAFVTALSLTGLIFFGNYQVIYVSKEAHNPIQLVSQYLIKWRPHLNSKLKIIGFIEKLSESQIGFTCYEFYQINSYNYYLLIVGWISNYILVLGFIN